MSIYYCGYHEAESRMIPEHGKLLHHLDETLDPARQSRISDLYTKTLCWQTLQRLPLVLTYTLPEDFPFRPYPFSEARDNPEKMLYNELVHAFDSSIACRNLLDDDLPCAIRANFGTVVIASIFGAEIEQVKNNNSPWIRPFESSDTFERILDCDPCDFSQGWCPKVVETYKFFCDMLSDFPNLQKCMKVVLPDLQGPFDTAEQLRGSSIYEDFYRAPESLYAVMHHLAQAQTGFAHHLQPYLSDGPEGYSHQHNAMIRGNILIRNDCAINISAKMYREQVAPHDVAVLEALGGGGIHCCGKCEHLVDEFLSLPAVRCVDFGQPEMNNIKAIYEKARQSKVPLIRIRVPEQKLLTGKDLDKFPTGVTLVYDAGSLEKAQRIMQAYVEKY
ncbi:MAG: hypothetical protein ACYS32_10420 [Planctomycetota bacterium]|jgi:hypothetical protein